MGIELWSNGINSKDIITKTQTESLAGGGGGSISDYFIVHLSDNTSFVNARPSAEKLKVPFAYTILSVWFDMLFESPLGSAAIVQIKNGATNIFSDANILTIPIGGSNVGPFIPNLPSVLSNDILNFDITQTGYAGKGYRITIHYQKV